MKRCCLSNCRTIMAAACLSCWRTSRREALHQSAAVFSQLSDPSRLRLLWLLCHCEECGVNLAAAVGMSAAAVSHHLRSLRLHGLITSRREGKEVYYTLSDTETARLVHRMVDECLAL